MITKWNTLPIPQHTYRLLLMKALPSLSPPTPLEVLQEEQRILSHSKFIWYYLISVDVQNKIYYHHHYQHDYSLIVGVDDGYD